MCHHNTPIVCIKEHHLVHKDNAADLIARNLGAATLFTTSATRNAQGTAVHRVGLAVRSSLLPLLISIRKVSDWIILAVFKGNPKAYIMSCYSPHNTRLEEEVLDFYSLLSGTVGSVPPHAFLVIGGDSNAHVSVHHSFHHVINRNRSLI